MEEIMMIESTQKNTETPNYWRDWVLERVAESNTKGELIWQGKMIMDHKLPKTKNPTLNSQIRNLVLQKKLFTVKVGIRIYLFNSEEARQKYLDNMTEKEKALHKSAV